MPDGATGAIRAEEAAQQRSGVPRYVGGAPLFLRGLSTVCEDELAYDLSPEQWLCYGISERRAGDLLCHVPVGMWQGPMPTAVERHLARLEVVHSFASTHMGHALRALCAPGVIPEAVLLQQGVSGLMETTQKAIALPMGNISRQLDYLRRALEDARRKAEGLPPEVSQEGMSEIAKAVRKMHRRRLFGLRPATIVGVKPVKDLQAVTASAVCAAW